MAGTTQPETENEPMNEETTQPETTEAGSQPVLDKMTSSQMMDSHAVEEDMLKPFAFGRFVARCPCLLCVVIMFILFIVMALISGNTEQLLSPATDRDAWPEGNADIDAYDAFIVATEAGGDTNTTTDAQSQRIDLWYNTRCKSTLI